MKKYSMLSAVVGCCVAISLVTGCEKGGFTVGANGIDSVSAPETLGEDGVKPTIATDRKNQPHIIYMLEFDGGVWGVWDKIGGNWRNTEVALSSFHSPAGTWNNPWMEIDPDTDRAWISGIMIIMGNYDGTGMGIATRGSMSTDPSGFYFARRRMLEPPSWATGNLSIEPNDGNAIVWINSGTWEELSFVGGAIQRTEGGSALFQQNLSERPTMTFKISKAGSVAHAVGGSHGVWHAAFNGHPNLGELRYSGYCNSMFANGQSWVAWDDTALRDGVDEDNFVGLCTDNSNPQAAYIAIDNHKGSIIVNIWNGSSMVYGLDSLFSVPGMASLPRYPPQLAPAAGSGAWLCYVTEGHVALCYISADGHSNGSPVLICPGDHPSIAVDSSGDIHLVYMDGNSAYYRKITTQ
jgi:hypothetical protein